MLSIRFSLLNLLVRFLGWLLLLLPTFALAAALPTVSRVKDINTTLNSGGSDPQNIVKIGNSIFFTAETPTTGRALWKTDGTAVGTVLVKDINPGSGGGSEPEAKFSKLKEELLFVLTAVGNVLYLSADDGINGWELWKSDGTAAGTVMVKDINAGSDSSFCIICIPPEPSFTAIGNVLYFRAKNGVTGWKLWKSDGTAAGTLMVKDIR